jgi:hypothetical protein
LVTTGSTRWEIGRVVWITRTTRRLMARAPGFAAAAGEVEAAPLDGIAACPRSFGTVTPGNRASGNARVGTDTSGAVLDSSAWSASTGTTAYGRASASIPKIASQMR